MRAQVDSYFGILNGSGLAVDDSISFIMEEMVSNTQESQGVAILQDASRKIGTCCPKNLNSLLENVNALPTNCERASRFP